MAGGAGELAGALQKASRFAQPVGRTGDLEFVVAALTGRMIVEDHVIAERLAGPVGEASFLESRNRVRQMEAGGLQVALHA